MKKLVTVLFLFCSFITFAQIEWHENDDYMAILNEACNRDLRVLIQFGEDKITPPYSDKIQKYFYCVYLPIESNMARKLEVKRNGLYILEKDGWFVWGGPVNLKQLKRATKPYFNKSKTGCFPNINNEFSPEPTKPVESTNPESIKPIENNKLESVKPVESTNPESIKSVENTKPESVKPVENTKPESKKPKTKKRGILKKIPLKRQNQIVDTQFKWNDDTSNKETTPTPKFQEADDLTSYKNNDVIMEWSVQLGVFSTEANALKYKAKLMNNPLITETLFLEYKWNDVLQYNYWHVMTGKFELKEYADRYAFLLLHKVCQCPKEDAIVKKLDKPFVENQPINKSW